jgi:two-component system sensor histidine kinase KdpD
MVSPAKVRAIEGYGFSIGGIALATLVAWLLQPYFTLVNMVMIFVSAVVGVAFFTGRGPSVLASLLASICFGYFYVPPRFVFAAEETQYLLTLLVMLGLSLLVSGLTARWREKALEAASKQREQATLYRYTRELAAEPRPDGVTERIARHLAETWGGAVTLFEPDGEGGLRAVNGTPEPAAVALAAEVWRDGACLGLEAEDGPLAAPLAGVAGPVAVAVFAAPDRARLAEGQELLAAMLTSGALALERGRYGEQAEAARMRVESERLRNSLLSAVSHDLRTPLAIIVGASSSLVEDAAQLTEAARSELTHVVFDEANRMRALVENLLDMARLEAGPVKLLLEWQAFEEILGAVLKVMRPRMGGRTLRVDAPNDMDLLRFDSALIERVLVNLLENAAKYTPEQAVITLRASDSEGGLLVSVLDNGPGLGGDTELVFNKFWRADPEGATPGVGLGLSICRSIIEAHGGRMWAENRPEGGACFCFTLPRAAGDHPAAIPLEVL